MDRRLSLLCNHRGLRLINGDGEVWGWFIRVKASGWRGGVLFLLLWCLRPCWLISSLDVCFSQQSLKPPTRSSTSYPGTPHLFWNLIIRAVVVISHCSLFLFFLSLLNLCFFLSIFILFDLPHLLHLCFVPFSCLSCPVLFSCPSLIWSAAVSLYLHFKISFSHIFFSSLLW